MNENKRNAMVLVGMIVAPMLIGSIEGYGRKKYLQGYDDGLKTVVKIRLINEEIKKRYF